LEANIAWGWNTCQWGLIDNMINGKRASNGCQMEYFGQGFGNDLPFWEADYIL